MSPILPPKEQPELKGSTVYLPESLWQKLADISDDTKKEPALKGYSRNEVIIHFLNWAVDEWGKEKANEAARESKKKK